ncbi:MAG: hypothetical protein HKN20_17940 [Gemmatimonadetes bacterium]|nr:hypothetical protein [Gemmatimonadota bacterium]
MNEKPKAKAKVRGEDRVDILVRAPGSLFVYWTLDGPSSRAERNALGDDAFFDRAWVLRIENVDRDERFDLPVDPHAGKTYVDVTPGFHYRADLGIASPSESAPFEPATTELPCAPAPAVPATVVPVGLVSSAFRAMLGSPTSWVA